jgi:hypothetical protein
MHVSYSTLKAWFPFGPNCLVFCTMLYTNPSLLTVEIYRHSINIGYLVQFTGKFRLQPGLTGMQP